MGLMDRVNRTSPPTSSPAPVVSATVDMDDPLRFLSPLDPPQIPGDVGRVPPPEVQSVSADAPAEQSAISPGPAGPTVTAPIVGDLHAVVQNAPAPAPAGWPALGLIPRAVLMAICPDWMCTAEGEKRKALETAPNIAAAMDFVGVGVRHNVMTRATEITIPGLSTARDDMATAALTIAGDVVVRAGMSRRHLKELLDAVAGSRPFHPVLDRIISRPWDGVTRRPSFRSTLVLENEALQPLRDALVDAWALQAIGALVQTEGVAAQGVLVLAGPQNIGKTRWVESLGFGVPGAVRTGMHLNPRDKDSVFQATSAWITELGELDHTVRHADVSALKAFITRPEDVLRRPYALTDNTYRRRTIFAGTVNGTGFLADSTGDRRFWVVAVRRCDLLPPEEMQQVWAEYKAMYDQGARWHLDAATYSSLNDANAEHRMIDPLEEMIRQRYDWETYTADPDRVRWVTATQVCEECGFRPPIGRADSTRAGSIVRQLNGGRSKRPGGKTLIAVPERAR